MSSFARSGPVSSEEAKAMHDARLAALREAEEAAASGMNILEGLSAQGSQLDHAERLAEEQEYMLARSRRTIRGMTWAGWLANAVTSEPAPPAAGAGTSGSSGSGAPRALPSSHQDVRLRQMERQRELSAPSGCGGATRHYSNPSPLSAGRSPAHPIMGGDSGFGTSGSSSGSSSSIAQEQMAAQDAYLAAQLRNVDRLHDMATTIGEGVVVQTEQLGHLDGQVERLEEESRALTRMEGRLFRKVRGQPAPLGKVVLQHVDTGRLLQCAGDDLHLSATLPPPPAGGAAAVMGAGRGGAGGGIGGGLGSGDPFHNSQFGHRPRCYQDTSGAVWEVWQRRDGVVGFRNCATRRWLGQTLLGTVRVRGGSFSHWEAFEMAGIGTTATAAAGAGERAKQRQQRQRWEQGAPILCCSANANGGGWLFLRSDGPVSKDQPGLEARDGTIACKKAAPKWRVYDVPPP
jgi:hypothetical protein